MENKDLLKKIEALENRITELEKQKKSNLSMFGRSYNLAGSSEADFLIKTKGLVKIQWGTKFIDLIKDGKINVDSECIFSVKTKDKIGIKDGIYIVLEDGSIYIRVRGGDPINLIGEVGTTYVSFLEGLETDSDAKYAALRNIGFIYPDISALNESALQNGIIYIESELRLFIMKDGKMSEFNIEFPNPFTELFVISKNDSSIGSLLIKGSGKYNSLAFDSFFIFTDEGNTYLESGGDINILIGEDTIMTVSKSTTTINNMVLSNTFLSIGGSTEEGFMLFLGDNGSTLIVDNLIVRNLKNSVTSNIYPIFWSKGLNIITGIEEVMLDDVQGYALSLKYQNTYKIGDYIYLYRDIPVDEFRSKMIKIPAIVRMLNTETGNIAYIEVLKDLITEDASQLEGLPDCVGKTTFLVGGDEKVSLLRYSEEALDIILALNIEEELDLSNIHGRIGVLDEFQLFELDNLVDPIEVPVEGVGLFLNLGYFKKASYIKDYELTDEDDSSKMASTEWIRKLLKKLIPPGTIVAYHGDSTIPDGWALCDGTNGTPNLIGKFIKAGISEEEGGSNEVLLEATNIPLLSPTTEISPNPGEYLGLIIPTLATLEEFVVDSGGSSNYGLDTGKKEGGNELKGLKVEDLPTVINTSSTVGSDSATQTPIKIEPEYYSLVFIMKVE